jgi:hypothetical protein
MKVLDFHLLFWFAGRAIMLGMKKYEKKTFDHKRLAELLNAAHGYVALSYYHYDELDDWYPVSRWRRMSWQQHKPSSLDAEKEAKELLLMNYAPTRGGLFDEA